jgi:hypothetical protein
VSTAERRSPIVVAVAFAAALIVLGAWLHPVAVPGGEYDAYAERAAHLLAGELRNDPFHGMLYPLLVAAVALTGVEPFAAGRVVSSLAAGALCLVLHRFVRERSGPTPAHWATVLLVANAPIALLGLQAASDMLATALLSTAVWLQLGAGRRGRVVAAGLCFGLVIAARPGLLPLGLPCALAFLLRGAVPQAGAPALGAWLLGAVAGWLPHAVPTALQFGSPFANENWRILVSKVAGWDVGRLHDPAESGLLDVVATHGAALWRLGVADLRELVGHAVGSLLAGRSPFAAIVWALAVLAAIGLLVAMRREGRRALLPVGLVVGYGLLVAFGFAPSERALLPIAALLLAAAVTALAGVAARWRPALHVVGIGWLAVLVHAGVSVWPSFVRSHPLAEIAAARDLQRAHGAGLVLAGTWPFLGNAVGMRAVVVAELPAARYTPAMMWQAIAAADADFFVCSGASFWPSRRELAAAAPAGAGIVRNDDVLVVRLPGAAADWLEHAEVVRAPDGRTLELVVRVRDGLDIVGAGFTVTPPQGADSVLALARHDQREFRATLPLPPGAAGRWLFTPGCVLPGNRWRTATLIELDLP